MTRLNNKDYKEAKKAFDREGYVVFEDVLSGNELTEYLNALQPFLKKDIKGLSLIHISEPTRPY